VTLPRVSRRLLLMLWHLAMPWADVMTEGVHVDLRLTHELLGRLIAAWRPTVSLTIQGLGGGGQLGRLEGGAWLVTGRGQEAIRRLTSPETPVDRIPGHLSQR
jgi:hypothetical protein